MAILWLYLMLIQSVRGAVRKGLALMTVYRIKAAKSAILSQQSRRNNWPPQPTECERSTRRGQAPTRLVDPADVTVLGQVQSGKGDKSDRGEDTPSKKKKSCHKSPKNSTEAGKSTDFKDDLKTLKKSGGNDWPG